MTAADDRARATQPQSAGLALDDFPIVEGCYDMKFVRLQSG
ncbi:hypothetical protein ACRCUN_20605 [Mycobacterium sp. LTG2003]